MQASGLCRILNARCATAPRTLRLLDDFGLIKAA
jgi:hypothetical protein